MDHLNHKVKLNYGSQSGIQEMDLFTSVLKTNKLRFIMMMTLKQFQKVNSNIIIYTVVINLKKASRMLFSK